MSHRFWTIFILSWAFGPLVLWVSLISTVRWYCQIQRSTKALVDQIHPLAQSIHQAKNPTPKHPLLP